MSSKTGESKTLDALKDLMLEPEKKQIQQIENRLNDPMLRAEEISKALPEAISFSVMRDRKLSRVIQPVIDDSLKESVKKNPKAIADAIFPALGPGIRKAISSTIMGMIQSLNQILNHSFSIQGLKWRFEAFKTRKQFAEVVLLHTLLYQVEQIFLIHRDTGIVLEHVVTENTITQDPDLVSGMLAAIQEFVKDSFHTESEDDLETLRIGSSRSVWIENGEHALIAAVIRGTPPLDLRIKFRELIEEIHLKSGNALKDFDGDTHPFSIFREQLKDSLHFQEKEKKNKISFLTWLLLLGSLSLLTMWGISSVNDHLAWSGYLDRVKSHKGLIILSTQKKQGVYHIFGLRDPLASDPMHLFQKEEAARIKVSAHWKPFYSLDPEFVMTRAMNILKPPETISLKLNNTTLIAQGKAPHSWIETFQAKALAIPGIDLVEQEQVQNSDKEKLDMAIKDLLTAKVYFKNNSIDLIDNQEVQLDRVFLTIQTILQIQHTLKTPSRIVIKGHTDSSGPEKLNLKLSRSRAETIFKSLTDRGIPPDFMIVQGVANKHPLKKEENVNDRQYNRAVSFKPFHLFSSKGN